MKVELNSENLNAYHPEFSSSGVACAMTLSLSKYGFFGKI